MLKLARREFDGPVSRISEFVSAAIEGARPYGDSPLWSDAVSATLALHQAPQHFLRSQLVLLGSLAGGGPPEGEALERFAAGMELLHLFMLVHDDVIDEARMRRGRPTLHLALLQSAPTLGAGRARSLAIVVGSTLHVLAMRHLLCGGRGRAACEVVLEACLHTGIGQFEDIVGWRGPGTSGGETVRAVIEDKAAYHAFAAPLAGGLRFANLDADLGPAMAWGRRMGVALQGLDDLGDFVGDPAVTGKDNFRDLLEGRVSLVLSLLFERASAEDRAFLESVVGRGALVPADRDEIERLLASHGVASGCAQFIRGELAEAERVRAASGFSPEVREGMSALEQGLLEILAALVA
ncbi:MAG TPA: polyprenyl synthetase family protein [Polyangia bacterium]|nr:polyprenyl synthetase family protein [Polyangia bacterium]